MPSGARKRKAAKKKKEQKDDNNNSNNSSSIGIHNNNNSNSSQENDDQKSQDGRDSDGSEVGSPVSQDQQNHQKPFNDGNEGSANRDLQVTTENKQMEGTARDAEGGHGLGGDDVDKIDTDFNSGQNARSEDVIVEHIESSKELHGDDTSSSSSSSSNSSSDDESQSLERKREDEKATDSFSKELLEISENGTQIKGTGCDSVGETVTDVDMVVPALPLPTDLVNPEVVEVVEIGFKENEDTMLPTSNDISQVVVVSQETEDKVSPALEDHVPASSDLISGEDVNEGKILTSSGAATTETSNVEEIVKASETSNGAIIGNEDKTMNLSGVHTDGTSTGSETVKAAVASNDTGNGNEEKYLASGAHPSEIVNGAEHAKSSESQPLVSSAPRVAQRTSWLSCCGLFDAFTGSS